MRNGTELRAAPPGPDRSAEGLAALNDDAEHPIDPGPCLTGSGERMELGYAVSVYAEHLYGRR